jgi:hypothetical protein
MWVVMPLGVKNGPPTYQRAITKAFCKYINVFMKIFLDDFTIFNDLSAHLEKLKNCFFKCKEFGISLNLNKFAFMVFLGTILGFIGSKEGKIMDHKKVEALINMLVLTTPRKSKCSMGWHSFTSVLSRTLPQLCHLSPSCSKTMKFLSG